MQGRADVLGQCVDVAYAGVRLEQHGVSPAPVPYAFVHVAGLGEVLYDMWFDHGHLIELVQQGHGEVAHADTQHTPLVTYISSNINSNSNSTVHKGGSHRHRLVRGQCYGI